MAENPDKRLVAEYERVVGHPPRNVHKDDPDWRYRGTKAERDELKERIIEEIPELEGQESLFDA